MTDFGYNDCSLKNLFLQSFLEREEMFLYPCFFPILVLYPSSTFIHVLPLLFIGLPVITLLKDKCFLRWEIDKWEIDESEHAFKKLISIEHGSNIA